MNTKQKMEKKYYEKNIFEEELKKNENTLILGIDEVGRGPLAGPVVVGGVILDFQKPIYGLDDSKKLSEAKRNQLNEEIKEKAIAFGTSSVKAQTIDKIGITEAIKKAMDSVIKKIEKQTEIHAVLVDYVKYENKYPTQSITKGDQKSNSIAAASIIAKVKRDTMMKSLAVQFPNYEFEKNKGYGTKNHIQAIKKYGSINKVHRYSFEPVKSLEKK